MFMRGERDGWVFKVKFRWEDMGRDGKRCEEMGRALDRFWCGIVFRGIDIVCMFVCMHFHWEDGKMDILEVLIRWEGYIDIKIRSFRIRNGSYVSSRLILISAVVVLH